MLRTFEEHKTDRARFVEDDQKSLLLSKVGANSRVAGSLAKESGDLERSLSNNFKQS